MNKKYGIGFLIGTILVIVLFAIVYRMSYNHALDKTKNETQEQVPADAEICYYLKDVEGYVTVYEADQKTVFDYTSILVSDLPENLQEDIKDGIKLTSLGQVYGFLENYSS